MKLLGVLREEGVGVLREWFQRDEIPLGLYIVGTFFVSPVIPIAFAIRVWKRMTKR
jgi:hypothetical protein